MLRRLDRTACSLALLGLTLGACSESEPSGSPDATVVADDAQVATPIDGGSPFPDSTVTTFPDAMPVADDASMVNGDAAVPTDAGLPGTNELAPGSHVSLAGLGRIGIGDTYAETVAKLGRGTRSMGMAQRSYEWALAGGVELTVWFTNTNLDSDDDPPADVDAGDRVLWIAVAGTFAGRTASGVGIGSTRAAVEMAYGASPRTTVLTMPAPGELTSYYVRGFLAAFGQDGLLRTFTVTKAYMRAPDGRIDIANARLAWGNDAIRMNVLSGSSPDDIRGVLGAPDSEGSVPNQNDFDILNYAFIGMEFLMLDANDRAVSAIIHAPFYGTTGNGTPGLGSTRTDFEAYAQQTLGARPPTASMRTMGLWCFTLTGGAGRTFGATYTSDMPPTVSAIILGQCQ